MGVEQDPGPLADHPAQGDLPRRQAGHRRRRPLQLPPHRRPRAGLPRQGVPGAHRPRRQPRHQRAEHRVRPQAAHRRVPQRPGRVRRLHRPRTRHRHRLRHQARRIRPLPLRLLHPRPLRRVPPLRRLLGGCPSPRRARVRRRQRGVRPRQRPPGRPGRVRPRAQPHHRPGLRGQGPDQDRPPPGQRHAGFLHEDRPGPLRRQAGPRGVLPHRGPPGTPRRRTVRRGRDRQRPVRQGLRVLRRRPPPARTGPRQGPRPAQAGRRREPEGHSGHLGRRRRIHRGRQHLPRPGEEGGRHHRREDGQQGLLLGRHPRQRHPVLLPLRRHAHRGPHQPAPAHRLHHQRHQVAAQGLRRPVRAGPVHPRHHRTDGPLRTDAAPPVHRGRLPHLGVRRLDHRNGQDSEGVESKAPANTLDWARFDKVWLA